MCLGLLLRIHRVTLHKVLLIAMENQWNKLDDYVTTAAAKACPSIKTLAIQPKAVIVNKLLVGVVAQLVERLVRNEKVRGSTPLGSTI